MKFFSRKALVAAAAAATISFGGAGAAMAQDTPAPADQVQPVDASKVNKDTDQANKNKENKKPSTEGSSTEGSSTEGSSSNIDQKDIKDWIGVFTAVISALGALFAFVNKYMKF
ncbi:hypothetical protein [Corynebacterium striatum]|uniref:hypothetical protein n=1 Tax=Corynebacterium striatum TaxID=43770 RepID=UPI003B59B281|nr:hypothetical protein [Corynebacterium striatum]HCD1825706.1 hypothetical protein [Corynebacterium striatum]HCD2182223.1 hypothetical protein [Corynebacterium striatum]HCD2851562.1 hypothetical protein [Corynebacterium striatum]HCD3731992.1 hypothetical protein [Corynebacterium striatum]